MLHYKLQKERKTVSKLHYEKCELQAALLASGATATAAQRQQQESLERQLQDALGRLAEAEQVGGRKYAWIAMPFCLCMGIGDV